MSIDQSSRIIKRNSIILEKKQTFEIKAVLHCFTGEEKMNITGLVKYVGKLGSGGGGSMFVGLKLDQPGNETFFILFYQIILSY